MSARYEWQPMSWYERLKEAKEEMDKVEPLERILPLEPIYSPKIIQREYEDSCLIEGFFRANPHAKVTMISCTCRRCGVWC